MPAVRSESLIKYVTKFEGAPLEIDVSPVGVVDAVKTKLMPLLVNEQYPWANRRQLAEDFLAILNQRQQAALQLVDQKARLESLQAYLRASSLVVSKVSAVELAENVTR